MLRKQRKKNERINLFVNIKLLIFLLVFLRIYKVMKTCSDKNKNVKISSWEGIKRSWGHNVKR